MKKITIFTPTFNRAYILQNLYESLCRQTSDNFEWLIVDDGSTDNTRELIEKWINEKIISIRYEYQINGGKMRAHNTGVKLAQTELFTCIDSDDYLVDSAVEEIINSYSNCAKQCAGIVAYKGKNKSEIMGDAKFPNSRFSTLTELYSNGFNGETTLIYRTHILKKHLFPEINNEKFITENYIYSQIDQEYFLQVVPKIITISSYRDDGYTNMGLKLKRDNPKGWALYYNQQSKFSKNKKDKIYFLVQYVCYALLGENKRIISNTEYKICAFFIFPAGILLKWKRNYQYRRLNAGN